MSHDTDTNPNPTPLGERSERIQRLRQAMRHPKILAADGWYTQEDDRIAPTDREYIAACDPATISELLSELDELWRIAGAYRPQKELADAVNRLNAEQAQRITLQHHAADMAQRVADLTTERDAAQAERDELRAQVHIVTSERDELASGMQALRARLAEIERQKPVAWQAGFDGDWGWCSREHHEHVRSNPHEWKGGYETRELYASPAPAAAPAQANAKKVTLNAVQLRHALDFIAPDFDADPDQRVAEVTIAWRDAGEVTDDDGNPEPAGYVAWITDYPGEGALRLSESWGVIPPAAPTQAESADQLDRPLPCDVTSGHVTIRKGSPLLALVARAEALSRMALAATEDGCGACGDACKPRGSCRLADESPQAELTRCQADCDGDCSHPDCPQRRDGEPHATGRSCPLGAEGGAA